MTRRQTSCRGCCFLAVGQDRWRRHVHPTEMVLDGFLVQEPLWRVRQGTTSTRQPGRIRFLNLTGSIVFRNGMTMHHYRGKQRIKMASSASYPFHVKGVER